MITSGDFLKTPSLVDQITSFFYNNLKLTFKTFYSHIIEQHFYFTTIVKSSRIFSGISLSKHKNITYIWLIHKQTRNCFTCGDLRVTIKSFFLPPIIKSNKVIKFTIEINNHLMTSLLFFLLFTQVLFLLKKFLVWNYCLR